MAELPVGRRSQASSSVAHFVAGVLDRESMVSILESLIRATELKPGDRVKSFRGSRRGKVIRLLADGRIVWKVDRSGSELIALPESLIRE